MGAKIRRLTLFEAKFLNFRGQKFDEKFSAYKYNPPPPENKLKF